MSSTPKRVIEEAQALDRAIQATGAEEKNGGEELLSAETTADAPAPPPDAMRHTPEGAAPPADSEGCVPAPVANRDHEKSQKQQNSAERAVARRHVGFLDVVA